MLVLYIPNLNSFPKCFALKGHVVQTISIFKHPAWHINHTMKSTEELRVTKERADSFPISCLFQYMHFLSKMENRITHTIYSFLSLNFFLSVSLQPPAPVSEYSLIYIFIHM